MLKWTKVRIDRLLGRNYLIPVGEHSRSVAEGMMSFG